MSAPAGNGLTADDLYQAHLAQAQRWLGEAETGTDPRPLSFAAAHATVANAIALTRLADALRQPPKHRKENHNGR